MAKTILTGVDNSPTALKAAHTAASLASAVDGTLHVLSAFTMRMGETVKAVQRSGEFEHAGDAYQKVVDRYRQNAEHIAETVVEALRIEFPDLDIVATAREGSPADALINESKDIAADIIVVGNKRVQGPGRFLGSIARSVAAEAPCDIYVANTRHD